MELTETTRTEPMNLLKQEKHDVLSDNDLLKFNGSIGIVVKEQRQVGTWRPMAEETQS